jgi:hypothetical protein
MDSIRSWASFDPGASRGVPVAVVLSTSTARSCGVSVIPCGWGAAGRRKKYHAVAPMSTAPSATNAPHTAYWISCVLIYIIVHAGG